MTKITGHKMYRKFDKTQKGFIRRDAVLPTQALPSAPSRKTRVEAYGHKWCAERGATFLHINFKKRVLHYLDENGAKKTLGLMLDEKDKKKYER